MQAEWFIKHYYYYQSPNHIIIIVLRPYGEAVMAEWIRGSPHAQVARVQIPSHTIPFCSASLRDVAETDFKPTLTFFFNIYRVSFDKTNMSFHASVTRTLCQNFLHLHRNGKEIYLSRTINNTECLHHCLLAGSWSKMFTSDEFPIIILFLLILLSTWNSRNTVSPSQSPTLLGITSNSEVMILLLLLKFIVL